MGPQALNDFLWAKRALTELIARLQELIAKGVRL